MSSETKPPSDWQAASLRFTAFYMKDGLEPPLSDWWTAAAGAPPAEELRRTKERQMVIAGPFADGALSLEYQPLKFDFKFHPLLGSEAPDVNGLPVLGPYESMSDLFVAAISKIFDLPTIPQLVRTAYGASLLHPVSDKVSAYQCLQGYLPSITIDVQNSSDFLYRINRKRPSHVDIPGLFINRLNTWSALRSEFGIAGMSTTEMRFTCRLDLDINTIPEIDTPLPKEKLPALLTELAEMAKEISVQGDRP